MDQIIKNLYDPSWWFTGVFFIVIGMLITNLLLKLFPILIMKMLALAPKLRVKLQRYRKKKQLVFIKEHRQHSIHINWLIGRFWMLALVGCLLISVAFYFYALLPAMGVSIPSKLKSLILFIPAYAVIEIAMIEKRKLHKVMNAHIAWCKRKNKKQSS